MRCLYCGNELALLKKLTGGGEFCSEAHRQKYQEEYNRLALSRLLQAQPAQSERPPLDPVRNRAPKTPESPPPAPAGRPLSTPVSAPVATAVAEPLVAAASGYSNGSSSRSAEPADPPQPGFLVARFEPVLSPRELFSTVPFLSPVAAFLPNFTDRILETRLLIAEPVMLPHMQTGWNMPLRRVEQRVDAREFTRVAPPIQLPSNGLVPDNPLPADVATFPPLANKFFEIPIAPCSCPTAVVVAALREVPISVLEFRLSAASMVTVLTEENRNDAPGELPAFPEPVETVEDEAVALEDDTAEVVSIAEPPVADSMEAAAAVIGAAEVKAEPAPEPVAETTALEETAEAIEQVPEPVPPAYSQPERPCVIIDLSIFGELEGSEPDPVAPQPETVATQIPPAEISPEVEDLAGVAVVEPAPVENAAQPIGAEPVGADAEPVDVGPVDVGPVDNDTQPVNDGTETVIEVAEPELTQPEPAKAAGPMELAAEAEVTEPAVSAAAPEPTRVPRLADTYLTVEILPFSQAFAQQAQVPPPAPPANFRVAAPTLEGVSVRPKMVYGARPEPKAASTPVAVPTSAAPEPAPKAQESGASVSRRDPRQESQQSDQDVRVENSQPPSETPAPVAAPISKTTVKTPRRIPEPVDFVEANSQSGGSTLRLEDVRLGLEQSELSSPLSSAWLKMGMGKRVAMGIGFVLALFIAGVLLRATFASKPALAPTTSTTVEAVGPSLITTAGSWSSDWAGTGLKGPEISLFRPSLILSDYRIEFQGQIENKSIGWVFRAANPKNYYAARIEIVKGGLQPSVNVVHYALINGEETQRTATPLPFPVHIDTVYKVRSDVYGVQFKTYIQEKLVDSWSDDRLKTGGFGLLTERGDRSQVRLVQLYELRAGK